MEVLPDKMLLDSSPKHLAVLQARLQKSNISALLSRIIKILTDGGHSEGKIPGGLLLAVEHCLCLKTKPKQTQGLQDSTSSKKLLAEQQLNLSGSIHICTA